MNNLMDMYFHIVEVHPQSKLLAVGLLDQNINIHVVRLGFAKFFS